MVYQTVKFLSRWFLNGEPVRVMPPLNYFDPFIDESGKSLDGSLVRYDTEGNMETWQLRKGWVIHYGGFMCGLRRGG
jgi:hypothetical protein